MKQIILAAFLSLISLMNAQTIAGRNDGKEIAAAENPTFYFEYSINGTPVVLNEEDVSTSYQNFGNAPVFKIFGGKQNGPQACVDHPGGHVKTFDDLVRISRSWE